MAPWHLDAPASVLPDLVELRLLQPEPTNRGGFRLRATLAIDSQVLRETEKGDEILVSLLDPMLHLASPGYPVRDDTKIGTPGRSHLYLASKPNGWTVQDTVGARGQDMISGEALVEIGPDGTAEGEVTLMLKGTSRTLRLSRVDAAGLVISPPVPAHEKLKILNVLFGTKLSRDADGAFVFARHAMRRKVGT